MMHTTEILAAVIVFMSVLTLIPLTVIAPFWLFFYLTRDRHEEAPKKKALW